MATVIVNNPVGSSVIYAGQYTSVWVKPYWGSAWRFAPFLFPESSIEAAAPSDSEAELKWVYGKYVNLWSEPGGTLLPLNLENWHVAILVHTRYGTYIGWIGEVVGESIIERGIDVETGLPRGEQTIECRGLEYLLERRVVLGTYVGNSEAFAYMPKTRHFNDTSSRRESLAGNRSAEVNQTSGTFLFSSDGNKWSNFNIIKYLLAAFQPWYPFEHSNGYVGYAPQFYMTGQTEALKHIYDEHRLGGHTLREALNSLIDRKRGLGWKIRTDGYGPIYIHVFSLAQFPIIGNNIYVPASTRQIRVPIHDDKFIEARFRISSTSQVDQIVVEGETPIKTCATIRFGDGSLEPAWDPDLDSEFALNDVETAYKTLADDLYTNWDIVHQQTYYPLVQFGDFYSYAGTHPANFAFLLAGGGNPYEALLAGFNVLDADGDGAISKEDLLLFTPNYTYQVVSEEMRATDRYASVFSHFRVPRNWTWPFWSPRVYANGYVDPFQQGAYWTHDTPFERHLPFMEPGSALGTEREYLEPFAIVEKPQRMRDILNALANAYVSPYNYAGAQTVVPDITQAEFDAIANEVGTITQVELLNGLAANPPQYLQLDRAQQLDYPACSLRMGDSGMRIIVKSEFNHVFGLNHINDPDAEFDYRTLAATVFFETDMMPRVVIPVWNNVYQDADGNTVYQASPIGKQIYIRLRGKEVWMAAPYTVKGLDGTNLVFYEDGLPGIIRDDTPDLLLVARLAWTWYAQQRASIDMTIKNQLRFFSIGDLIISAISGWSQQRIGTCVTSIRRNYQAKTHEVSTGYGEMDPSVFGSKHR
jgi:hypothetical protein